MMVVVVYPPMHAASFSSVGVGQSVADAAQHVSFVNTLARQEQSLPVLSHASAVHAQITSHASTHGIFA
jgi:hypothetical protein